MDRLLNSVPLKRHEELNQKYAKLLQNETFGSTTWTVRFLFRTIYYITIHNSDQIHEKSFQVTVEIYQSYFRNFKEPVYRQYSNHILRKITKKCWRETII